MALGAMLLAGCANRGLGPQGGPKDETPPKLVKEVPASGTTNFHGNKVTIGFNEYLQLDNVADNVLISPPSRQQPEVKAWGKSVHVTFVDSLLPNTTYSVNFGNAICDYHEKNPYTNYTYSFSTGDQIDTLLLGGLVVLAENLNPVYKCYVGIHRNLSDTAISKIPFTQVARTDSSGVFFIHNIQEGTYRLYGLMDGSRDYLYQPGEAIAYANDPIHVDTTTQEQYPVLYLFEEDKVRHYLGRTTREKRNLIQTVFSAPQDSMPRIVAPWYERSLLDASVGKDTLRFWLLDSADIAQDSLEMEITYAWSDSLYNLVDKTDTVTIVYHESRMTEKARRKKEAADRVRPLGVMSNASSRFQVYDTLRIDFDCPARSLCDTMIHLTTKHDSTEVPVPIRGIQPIDSAHLHYHVLASLVPGESYTLLVDSAAAYDVYGHCCKSCSFPLTLRRKEDYATLKVNMTHFDKRAVIQLLSDKDTPIRSLRAQENGVLFDHLDPATRYLRLYIDQNGDGKWTTGDWLTHRQPEPVYYFPSKLNLKANWDFEESFDHEAMDQLDAKPEELIKVYTGQKKE